MAAPEPSSAYRSPIGGGPRSRSGSGVMRALVIQHEQNERVGLIGEWAAHRGVALVPALTARRPTIDPVAFDLVIVLGARESVYDHGVPWIADELAVLERAIAHDVPVFGTCFGAQLLATALGGRVAPLGMRELGWHPVETFVPELISPGPWWEFHSDAFTVPPGAVELARTPLCPQAFAYGPHLGVQFHPEITFKMHQTWARAKRDEVAALGLDRDMLLRESGTNAERARPAIRRLMDGFVSRMRSGSSSGAPDRPMPLAGRGARARDAAV